MTNTRRTSKRTNVSSVSEEEDDGEKEISTTKTSTSTIISTSQIVKTGIKNVFLSFYPRKQSKAEELASQIEDGMSNTFKTDSTIYKSKYRSITLNLKDPRNSRLRELLWSGDLAIEDFLKMSPAQMANDEIIQERQKLIEDGIKMVVLDNEQAAELSSTLGGQTKKFSDSGQQSQSHSPTSTILVNSIIGSVGSVGDTDGSSNSITNLNTNISKKVTSSSINTENTYKKEPPKESRRQPDWFTCIFAFDVCPLFDVDAYVLLNNSSDGRSLNMEEMPQNYHLAGRIEQERASTYCEGIWNSSSSRYIDLVLFSAPPQFPTPSFDAFVEYFASSKKWATVVVDVEQSSIRDFYLVSLRTVDDLLNLPPSIKEIIEGRDLLSLMEYPLIMGIIVSAYRPKETKSNAPQDLYDPVEHSK